MGVIAKYKFNNTLEANLLPEFNSEFTSDLYTVTDEVSGEVTTRTIESESLPTLMRFGVAESSVATERSKSLLEIISLDISNCKNLYHNFRYCINLTTVNGLNIHSGITGLDNTFGICSSLEFVDTSNWDTSNVTSMSNMFNGCSKLTSLDVSNWDTSNVANMTSMFNGCSKLTSLDVSGWDTSKLTKMGSMFNNCSQLTSLDVSGWDTSAATNMYSMFNNCSKLTSLDVSGWDTGEVTNMSYMFGDCSKLTSLDVSGWDISKVTNISNTFSGCSQLTSLDLSGWNISVVTNMSGIFSGCSQLTSLDVSGWNTSNVDGMYYIFDGCSKLTSLDVSGWDISAVTDMESMFCGCSQLTSLNVSGWDTSNVINMGYMFAYCNKLTTLDVSNFNMISVTDTTDMFSNTPLLTDIGVLYMDKSSLQKLVDAMPTNLSKTLWYKDVNIDGITHGDNITLKKYMEGNVEIILNSPLLEGDTIEVKDGKLCHVHRYGKVVLDGSEDFRVIDDNFDNVKWFGFVIEGKSNSARGVTKSDKFPYSIQWGNLELIQDATTDSAWECNTFIAINKSKLSTLDTDGFKQWLQANPTTVVYQLAEPYYEDITNLQSAPTLKTYLECSMEIDTDLPIDTNITYRTNLSSVYVMERELDTLDSGVSLSNLIEEEVDE